MREFDNDPNISQTVELMNSYGLDLYGYTIEEIMSHWLDTYHANWIRLATIEALYLGRYKAISIEQILTVWARVGTPNTHFSHEFERLICRKLPRNSADLIENISVTPSLEEKILAEKIAALGQNKEIAAETVSTHAAETISNHAAETVSTQTQTQTDDNNDDNSNIESNPENTLKSLEESITSEIFNLEISPPKERSQPKPEPKPIHNFTPIPDVSDFYNKLKSLAQEKLEEQ